MSALWKNYQKGIKTMFEVTYSLNGLIKKIMINAIDAVQVTQIMTNMYGTGNIRIINIRRV